MTIREKFFASHYLSSAIVLVGALLWLPSLGYAATATSSWPAGQAKTEVTNINGPGNAQQTSFTSFGGGGPYNYVMYPFTVTATGNYTATSTTGPSVNTTWFVKGIYSAGTPTATPLSDFIVAVLAVSPSAGVWTGTFTSVPLVAGQQYTMLVAYNVTSVAGEVSTVTIDGPGCVAIGSNVCAPASIPTLSVWGMLLMAISMVVAGVFTIRRKTTAFK